MTTLFGELEAVGTGLTLSMERILTTDVATLWSAVTEPHHLARWMNRFTGDLVLGGTWQALLDDGSVYSEGTVLECDPEQGFVTSWRGIQEEPSVVRVRVDAVDGGSRLTLTHEGLHSIFYGAGWQAYLEQLDDLLGAAPTSVIDPSRVSGTEWDARFLELRTVWEQEFGRFRS